MATLNLPVVGQDSGTWGQKVNAALEALNAELVDTTAVAFTASAGRVTDGPQSWSGVKTFVDIPVVPDASWPVAKIAATGERTNAKYLRADGVWEEPPGSTGGGGANTLGTFNNPITDAASPRPTGLTRVVWDTATDPTNRAVGDYNLQKGTVV